MDCALVIRYFPITPAVYFFLYSVIFALLALYPTENTMASSSPAKKTSTHITFARDEFQEHGEQQVDRFFGQYEEKNGTTIGELLGV